MKNEALEEAIDIIEDKIAVLKIEIKSLFKGNSGYEFVADQIRYNNKLLSLLKKCEVNPDSDTSGGLHLACVNPRYLFDEGLRYAYELAKETEQELNIDTAGMIAKDYAKHVAHFIRHNAG